jgi:pimeloyl-ACP methyl ester carboxylesterase
MSPTPSPATIPTAVTVHPASAQSLTTLPRTAPQVTFGSINVDGLNIAYRESGDPKNPKLVLLHGFPASSHQYRNLVPALADQFHVIAPDYQGFGNSDIPDPASYAYTFDGIALTMERFFAAKGFDHYGMFVQDYGGPVGFRIAGHHPESLEWLIVQNSNAYEEGFTAAWDGFRGALWKNRSPKTEKPLAAFLTHDAIKSIYLHGSAHPELISPDNWESDYGFMQRPHAVRINLDLFYDYRTNVDHYPQWQEFLRNRQPKTLIFWGQDDVFFTPQGGEAFLRDLPQAELHRLAAGHFAVEDHLEYIAINIKSFYDKKVRSPK